MKRKKIFFFLIFAAIDLSLVASTEEVESPPQEENLYDQLYDDLVEELGDDAGLILSRIRRENVEIPCNATVESLAEMSRIEVERIYPTSMRLKWEDVMNADAYQITVKSTSTCIRATSNGIIIDRVVRDDEELEDGIEVDDVIMGDDVIMWIIPNSGTAEQIAIHDLDAGTDYIIEGRIRNGSNCGLPLQLTVRTPDVDGGWTCENKDVIPDELKQSTIEVPLEGINTNTAVVTWSPIPTSSSYTLFIEPPIYGSEGKKEILDEEFEVEHLSPGGRYNISIVGIDTSGSVIGRRSKQVSIVTRLETPTNVKTTNKTSVHCRLEWDKPANQHIYFNWTLFDFDQEDHPQQLTKGTEIEASATFLNLKPASRYMVTLKALDAVSYSAIENFVFWTKLPTPAWIEVSNVTSSSADIEWAAVDGVIKYEIILENANTKERVNHEEGVTGTRWKLTDLDPAVKHLLMIVAKNSDTNSLPAVEYVYTRLKKISRMEILRSYVQDTSIVLCWTDVAMAYWYKVEVNPAPLDSRAIREVPYNDTNSKHWTKIENLSPGVSYTVVVYPENHRKHNTTGLPIIKQQTTRLSTPDQFTANYDKIFNTSMVVSWKPVHGASEYLILVFDCSGEGSTIGDVSPPDESANSDKDFCKVPYPLEQDEKLRCGQKYKNVEHAYKDGEKNLPSQVEGQGRTAETSVELSKMLPATGYEIMIVSFQGDLTSKPTVIRQFTKLKRPDYLTIDPQSLLENSVQLNWENVTGANFYKLEIIVNRRPDQEKEVELRVPKLQEVEGDSKYLWPLHPSTNYTFKLIACNDNTTSFPVTLTTFTRLQSPSALSVAPEDVSTDSLFVQWGPVEDTEFYIVQYKEGTSEKVEEVNVTETEIELNELHPNTMYDISVVSVNRFTRSLESTTKVFTELPMPTNFTVVEVTESTIELNWDEVPACDFYRLALLACGEEEMIGDQILVERWDDKTDESTYKFESLTSDFCYRIVMIAASKKTKSRQQIMKIHTKLSRPQQVGLTEVKDHSFTLQWMKVTNSEVYSVKLQALYEESSQTTKPPEDELIDVIHLLDRKERGLAHASAEDALTRQKRDIGLKPRRSKRQDASRFVPITYKRSNSGDDVLQAFPDSDDTYVLNVTYTDIKFRGLQAGMKYAIELRAINTNTDSLPVKLEQFTNLESPKSVETFEVRNDSLNVRWLQVDKADYYYVRVVPEFAWSVDLSSGEGNTSKTEMTINGLEPNTKYEIHVNAGNSHVTSDVSKADQITKLSPAENFHVVEASVKSNTMMVEWDNIMFADSYIIDINPPNRQRKKSFTSHMTSYQLNDLNHGTLYQLTIKGMSKRTDGMERVIQQYTRLSTPEDMEIVPESVTSSSFTVRWSAVPGADQYELILGNKTDARQRQLITDKTSVELEGLQSGEVYYVTLTANNTAEMSYSDPITVQNFTKLETPTNFFASREHVTDTSMNITWDEVSLADEYELVVGIEQREDDDYSIYMHLDLTELSVERTWVQVEDLKPASYYKISMKAVNRDTESFSVELFEFTKLERPTNVTLLEGFYMDTEAEIEWERGQDAEYHIIEVYKKKENEPKGDPINEIRVEDDRDYYNVVGLEPLTSYEVAVRAVNKDTESDNAVIDFTTKSACSDDFHFFANTHLSQSLPLKSINNATMEYCVSECCSERSFNCRSVSLHRTTKECLLFQEDRILAPPLAISKVFDHYERKFWKEVSGFQIRSVTHNNAAVTNETVELTLTFVYLGKSGCVFWDFADGQYAFHSIHSTNCSHLCDEVDTKNCTIIDTKPSENSNQIKIRHDFEQEDIFDVKVRVTDDGSVEEKKLKVAINKRGCIYPTIQIEDEGKSINNTKKLFRSKKVVITSTPNVVCKQYPGVKFTWRALIFKPGDLTPTGSIPLESKGSEILIPSLTFPLGLYLISVDLKLLDETQSLQNNDAIYMDIIPSPLVAQISGGDMRTVGAGKFATWNALLHSHDPDLLAYRTAGLIFNWFCRRFDDEKFLPLKSSNCVSDPKVVDFEHPGIFHMNTSVMQLYTDYYFKVVVMKKGRKKREFQQKIIVKEGDPPDFFIKCAENCKRKVNPTQALALSVKCRNCQERRLPKYKWVLYKLIPKVVNESQPLDGAAAKPRKKSSQNEEEDQEDLESKYDQEEVIEWEKHTTTGSVSPVVVLNKNFLVGGNLYLLRINVSMNGLDGRVFSYSDFRIRANLPPYGGVCLTSTTLDYKEAFVEFGMQHLGAASPMKILNDTKLDICKEHCTLTREFMCVSLSYHAKTETCWLFNHNKESLDVELDYQPQVSHYQRIFYRGGAVVDEVMFECRDWKDEGDKLNYPKSTERSAKVPLTYKFTTLPQGNQTKGLLLYFGNVPKTPGISMALGSRQMNFTVSAITQVCDLYGECAISNIISMQIVPPDSPHLADTLSGLTSGNASKMAILSQTGNSKAAAQLAQSISSILNVDDDDEAAENQTFTTTMWSTTTQAPTTTTTTVGYYETTASYGGNRTHGNASAHAVARQKKSKLRSEVVDSLSTAATSMTSIENLQQMTSAMSSITNNPNEIDTNSQKKAANTMKSMAGELSSFSEDSNKADIASAANNIVGSLGKVAKASETDLDALRELKTASSEIDYTVLDDKDLSPDELRYYAKLRRKKEKGRVRRAAMESEAVMESAIGAITNTANALLDKQLQGEPSVDVESAEVEMKVEKTSPGDIGKGKLKTNGGSEVKLPSADSLLGKNSTNMSQPIDLRVTAFKENPFAFGEDAALINSPVTMLDIGQGGEPSDETEDDGTSPHVGISVPSTSFNPLQDMVRIERSSNDTSLSISKFEVISNFNAVLILLEPDDDRAKFDVYIRQGEKPSEEEYDMKFELPHKIWDVDIAADRFKIFIPEDEIEKLGVYYVGIRDVLNITSPPPETRIRRRRSIGTLHNSTTYHFLLLTPGCRRFDQKLKKWSGAGCKVDERSTPEVTECECETKFAPSLIFSAEFFVPPNTINFATVWAKVDIADNPAVFATVISLVCMFIIGLVLARRQDRKDAKKWQLKSCLDNRREDNYLYQVTIFTGHNSSASTQSKIYCVFYGETAQSRVRRLAHKEGEHPYVRGSVIHLLLREEKSLGKMSHIHIWHDNRGKGDMRSWYLDQVVVQDIRTGKRWYFICDQWLAVDDGDMKVDRIVPKASSENMSTFNRLFMSTTSQKFTEDHLWISLFYRPTKSNFTRTQRLCCCMALLFMTMIANAMFFRAGSKSEKSGTSTIKVGPFTVSPIQIWTSFCSTILVVPVTTIIMMLFKKAKTKEQEESDKQEKEELRKVVNKFNQKQKLHEHAGTLPDPSQLMGCDAVYTINEDGTINAKPNIYGRRDRPAATAQWPHWCVYIAWVLTWIAVLSSGFFAIMYSFEWGREKANKWLSCMMLSFWQSVIIVQPIKVIFLSMFVAMVLKKPDESVLDTIDEREIKETDRNFLNVCADDIEAEACDKDNLLAPPKPPSKRKLKRARRLRKKEKAMSSILWEVCVYFMYIMILLFLCHGSRDSRGQLINENIKRTFIHPTPHGLHTVNTVEYFWNFVNFTLIPNLYSHHWYNGAKKNWRERSFLTDEQSYRVGPARLRQIRIKSQDCPNVGSVQTECRSAFILSKEETQSYAPGWKSLSNLTDLMKDDEDDDDADDPLVVAWEYQTWRDLKGIPFVGNLALYPGGGYSAELGVNYDSGKLIIDSLYEHSWIDHNTRGVFAEFTLYNPNVNLFTGVEILVEFPATGAAVSMSSILTYRPYQHLGSYGTVMVLAQLIYLLHLLNFTYKQIKRVYLEGRAVFKDPWNYYDFAIMLTDWAVTVVYIIQLQLLSSTMERFHENKRKFVNFQQVMTADSIVATLLAISAFFGIIRFLKLLRFNRKIGMLTSVLKNSARQWPGFFILALVFYIAFIHIGYVVFCPFMEDFKSLLSASETMMATTMGRPIYAHLRDIYRWFGPLFYFIFSFTAAFIILNILISIINESYTMTLDDMKSRNNEYEIVEFMMKRFSKWSGIDLTGAGKGIKYGNKTAPLSSEIPLPTLPYELENEESTHNVVNLQKALDRYVFELEENYNKYLKIQAIKEEVGGEMGDIQIVNNKIQKNLLKRVRSKERRKEPRNETSPTGNWMYASNCATTSHRNISSTN